MNFNADRSISKIRFMFRIFGCWRSEPSSRWYSLYSIMYLVLFPACLTFFMFMFLWRLDNYEELSYGLYMFLTQFCGLIKVLCFQLRNSELRQFFERIKMFQVHGDFEEKLVTHRSRFFDRVSALYYTMAITALHITILMAIFSETARLPFSSWYPMLDWQNDAQHYWIAIAYQYVAIISACFLIQTVDAYFNFSLFVVSIQLEIIGHRLRAIGSTIKNLNCVKMCEMQQSECEETQRLVECVKLHIEVVDFKEKIENCFNIPFFFQAIASSIVISSIVNEMIQVNQNMYLLKNVTR